MNRIPVVRDGEFNSYLTQGARGGVAVALVWFFLFLIWNSFVFALLYAFCTWIGIILMFLFGFVGMEYVDRRMKLKKLYSSRYSFLDAHHFTLHEELYFTGQYKGYWMRVIPMTQWRARIPDLEYLVIESYYQFESGTNAAKRERSLCGEYRIGHLHFSNQCVGYIPHDHQNPNFEENFNELVSILCREHLSPLSLTEWKEAFGDHEDKKEV